MSCPLFYNNWYFFWNSYLSYTPYFVFPYSRIMPLTVITNIFLTASLSWNLVPAREAFRCKKRGISVLHVLDYSVDEKTLKKLLLNVVFTLNHPLIPHTYLRTIVSHLICSQTWRRISATLHGFKNGATEVQCGFGFTRI